MSRKNCDHTKKQNANISHNEGVIEESSRIVSKRYRSVRHAEKVSECFCGVLETRGYVHGNKVAKRQIQ